MKKNLFAAAALILTAHAYSPHTASAHCDTLDGPLVVEARSAIDKADIAPLLKWVKEEEEHEIKEAFQRTLAVRALGSEAQEMADMYFFETLVRIHRAGEGAPYTGLKPAGLDLGPAVTGADRALISGDIEPLANAIGKHVSKSIRDRFHKVMETKKHSDESAAKGREYVDAYVFYVHFVEAIHNTVSEHGAHQEKTAAEGAKHAH